MPTSRSSYRRGTETSVYEVKRPKEKVKAYLGVDVGSISTNLVAIDEQKNVLAKRYLMTEGGRWRRSNAGSAR